MLVMPANNGRYLVHYWAGLYGNLGHLYSPGGQRGPFKHLPYALDNGAYSAHINHSEWDADAFKMLLAWAGDADIPPMWVACPDVVADACATMKRWDEWSPVIRDAGFNAAMVVQDGMTLADVRAADPDAVFIGGSTEWKWLWLWRFCDSHPVVHVGRVNGYRDLIKCYRAGASSCDGTGWFRGDQDQLAGLERFLREQSDNAIPAAMPSLYG